MKIEVKPQLDEPHNYLVNSYGDLADFTRDLLLYMNVFKVCTWEVSVNTDMASYHYTIESYEDLFNLLNGIQKLRNEDNGRGW